MCREIGDGTGRYGTATYSSFSPEVREISFQYQSAHDPAAPDGNQSTAFDHFDPEYYAQAIVRASQYPAGPDEGEWKFLALTIQPNASICGNGTRTPSSS